MIFLWFNFAFLLVYFVFFYHHRDVTSPYYEYFVLLGALDLFVVVYLITSLGVLYSAPHARLNNTLQHETAHHLLDCASIQIPNMEHRWHKIDDCIQSAVLYNLTSVGKIPYSMRGLFKGGSQHFVTAFVIPDMDTSSVFVTSHFTDMGVVDQALVLIHECAHIALNAVDHAYRWEREFTFLSEKQHLENADSFMDAVLYHCT
tara:strand:+ start:1647 stop:2255 length:609 start_codon:yes stop_codon:yes gene_type:complete